MTVVSFVSSGFPVVSERSVGLRFLRVSTPSSTRIPSKLNRVVISPSFAVIEHVNKYGPFVVSVYAAECLWVNVDLLFLQGQGKGEVLSPPGKHASIRVALCTLTSASGGS